MTRRVFLDPHHEAAFREDGYVMLDLLTGSDVERLLGFYAQFQEQHAEQFTTSVLMDDAGARRRIHDEVGGLFQERLLPLLDRYRIAVGSYSVKQAGASHSKVGLHQDFTFVDERSRSQCGLSVWCPLIEVGLENGCLGVVRGSHPFNDNYRDPCFLPYHDLLELIESEYMSYLPMRAGQALVMDNRLFHGSPENRSERTRIVAAGIAVPCESQLLYCHRDYAGDGTVLEVYEVPADFYLHHSIPSRPAEGRHVATVPRRVAPLTPDLLRAQFTPAAVESRNANLRLQGSSVPRIDQ
jgi:hypothetical protein